jgi:hypothetical protein
VNQPSDDRIGKPSAHPSFDAHLRFRKNQFGVMITSDYNQMVARPDEGRQGAKYLGMMRDNCFGPLTDPSEVFHIALCVTFGNH